MQPPAAATRGPVGLVYDERMMAHEDPDKDHPEQPARIDRIFSYLQSTGLAERYRSAPHHTAT